MAHEKPMENYPKEKKKKKTIVKTSLPTSRKTYPLNN